MRKELGKLKNKIAKIINSILVFLLCFSYMPNIIVQAEENEIKENGIYAKIYDTNEDGIEDTLVLGNKKDFIFEEGTLITEFEEDATNMLKKEYPVSDIVEITGLTMDKVLELQKGILVKV